VDPTLCVTYLLRQQILDSGVRNDSDQDSSLLRYGIDYCIYSFDPLFQKNVPRVLLSKSTTLIYLLTELFEGSERLRN